MLANRDLRSRAACAAALMLILALLVPARAHSAQAPERYVNPVAKEFADDFPDVGVIRAKDGYWYSYSTTTPLRLSNFGTGHAGNRFIPMARSKDLVSWEYVGDVFSAARHPEWVAFEDTYYWAPEIRYVDGKYYLYYSVAAFAPDRFTAIGVATAPTPTGPWTDSGGPVVGRSDDTVVIDPALFVDTDGARYLYYGSFGWGGVRVTKLSADGKRAVGESRMVVSEHRGEAPYVVRRGRHYYLFYSGFGCCAGVESSYPIFVGRSTSPLGPFLDREEVSLTGPRPGGTIVNSPNGNRWTGTGHNAITTDLAGQEWTFFNGYDKDDGRYRTMLMDRLDWVEGWPTVRAGAWASEGRQRAPVTAWVVGDDFNGRGGLPRGWRSVGTQPRDWRVEREDDAGGYVRQVGVPRRGDIAYLVASRRAPTAVRAEADLRLPAGSRGAAGLVVARHNSDNYIVAWLDAEKRALVTDVRVHGRSAGLERTPLHRGFRFDTWHNVAIEVRGRTMSVEVTAARLGDPAAAQERRLPPQAVRPGSVGVASRAARIHADNVGATRLYEPVTEMTPDPEVGRLQAGYSDEFEDGALHPAWSWVRTPDGEETGGVYRWPTQARSLVPGENAASVLLRDAPEGAYTVETKLYFPLGVDTERNYAQAGLIAHANENLSVRVAPTSVLTTRQALFWRGLDEYAWPEMMLGPSADLLWLRLSHRVDPENGEHEYRAATSRDGRRWVWGGVWTMPAGVSPRIGLVSMGGAGVTAEFEYFRVYRP